MVDVPLILFLEFSFFTSHTYIELLLLFAPRFLYSTTVLLYCNTTHHNTIHSLFTIHLNLNLFLTLNLIQFPQSPINPYLTNLRISPKSHIFNRKNAQQTPLNNLRPPPHHLRSSSTCLRYRKLFSQLFSSIHLHPIPSLSPHSKCSSHRRKWWRRSCGTR